MPNHALEATAVSSSGLVEAKFSGLSPRYQSFLSTAASYGAECERLTALDGGGMRERPYSDGGDPVTLLGPMDVRPLFPRAVS